MKNTLDNNLISRQAVHDLIAELLSDYLHDEDREKIEKLDVKIEALPSVTPKEKTGKWIDITVGDMPAQACDQCNTFYPLSYTGGGHNYCPNCGARMEVEK